MASVLDAVDSTAAATEMSPPGTFPTVVSSADPATRLLDWMHASRPRVQRLLTEAGAVLLRGFVVDPVDFENVCVMVSGALMDYEYRSNRREQLSGKLFNSTEYPASEAIPFHNEMSYFSRWPKHIWFMCQTPAAAGGDTPLADSAEVLHRIPADVREPFERLGVRYTRTMGPDLDLSWQEVFQTDDRAIVDEYCTNSGLEHEWLGDDRLRTAQHRPAVISHPHSGEPLWFNQAHLFHPSSLGSEVYNWLIRRYGVEQLPRNAFYGDGTPIPLEVLDVIRSVYLDLSRPTRWQRDDVLVFDNMRFAHARGSFTPPRRVIVGLGGAVSGYDLVTASQATD